MSSAEIAQNFTRYGCHHIACGRYLTGTHTTRRTAAEPRLETKMRGVAPVIEPVRHIVEGARAYNSLRGLPDPHDGVDYHGIRQTADRVHHLSRAYAALPHFDKDAVPHFEAMRDEVRHQFDHLTNRMGVRAEFVEHDPYRNAREMAEDLRNNRRIQVLKTASTGSHPFFTDHENDMFRAVHDAFGHAGTGRDFDGHGEEAAFHSHARMFSPLARGALATETRGQNGFVIDHDMFGPQKIAVMHKSLWTPEGLQHTGALDLEEYRLADDAQRRRYETAGNVGGRSDYEAYFGQGEHAGGGRERRVTLKDFMQHSRSQGLDDTDPGFQEEWRGHELGYRHGRSGRVDNDELTREHARSPHPDRFVTGYHEGLSSGFGEDMPERIAVLRGPDGDPVTSHGAVVMVPVPTPGMARTAHVSGNQVDVLHCFAGEERYLTPEGPKTFAETVGTVQKVLTSARGTHEGEWVEAPIRCYGEQEIWELTLTRNKQRKVIRTTAGHRWMVGRPGGYRTVTTENLREGHRLAHLRTLIQNVEPSRDGIRQGVMFGDGSIVRRDYGQGTYGFITLWGDKAKDLSEYFDEIAVSTRTERENGLTGVRYSSGMAGWSKELPPLSASPEFLRGWLMGYIAADGDVDRSGKVSLSSSVIENLEYVRNVATLLGLGTYGITLRVRAGYNAYDSAIYSVAFASGDLDNSWLLRQKHRDKFSAVKHRYDRFGWTVAAVERTDEIAPVYCAEVPGTESFALEDNVWTKNCPFCGSGGIVARSDGSIECSFCNSAFTVTVSPVYPSFPMSINGQPYPWPGRPADAVDPTQAGDPDAAAGDGYGGSLIPDGDGGGPDAAADGDGDDPADADAGDDSDDGDDSDGDDGDRDQATVGGKKKPPFGKKSYRTATGALLPEAEYVRHLALKTSHDPNAMAAQIRRRRAARTPER